MFELLLIWAGAKSNPTVSLALRIQNPRSELMTLQ